MMVNPIVAVLIIVISGALARYFVSKMDMSAGDRFLERTLWRIPPWKYVKHNPLRLKEQQQKQQQQ